MKCTIELSPHVVSRSGRRFLHLVRHGISRFRKRPTPTEVLSPTLTTCVYVRSPPFSFTPLPFHPRPTIVLYRVFHENAFSRLPSFIFPFPFLFLPDSPWFPRVLVTTGSSIRNESVSREWRVSRNREFQGGIKGNFIVPEDGGTNGSRFSFTNVSITRERSSLRSEKSREPPLLLVSEYILISIEISLCHDARGRKLAWKIGRIESKLSSAYCSRDCENGGRRGAGKLWFNREDSHRFSRLKSDLTFW